MFEMNKNEKKYNYILM